MDHIIHLSENDTTFADFTHMRVVHYNRTERVWSGNLTFFVDVGDDYEIESRLYKNSGNQLKITPFRYPRSKFCETAKNTDKFDDLRTSSNLPARDVCPWPKGTYEIYAFSIDLTRLPPIDGQYMAETTFYKSGELLNGYQVFVTVIKT